MRRLAVSCFKLRKLTARPFTSISEEVESKLYKMTLANTNRYGWTDRALTTSAIELGFSPSLSRGIFSNGIIDVIHKLMRNWNLDLESRYLNKIKEVPSNSKLSYLVSQPNFKDGIRERLMLQSPFISTWSQAINLGLRPTNILTTQSILWETVNIITQKNEAVPFAYKVALFHILVNSEFYMLTDRSRNYSQTFKYIDSSIDISFKVLQGFSIVGLN